MTLFLTLCGLWLAGCCYAAFRMADATEEAERLARCRRAALRLER